MKTIAHTLKKTIYLLLVTGLIVSVISCGSSTGSSTTAADFTTIQDELQDKFGDNAYYTDFTVTYNSAVGNIVGVTVTEDPSSLKMGQWNYMQGNWKQNSDITLEVPQGTQASDYMFQLGEAVSLSKLGELVEQAIEKVKEEKGIPNPTLSIAGLNYPDDGNLSKAEYLINITPENGGTTFSFFYKLDGELVKMDY